MPTKTLPYVAPHVTATCYFRDAYAPILSPPRHFAPTPALVRRTVVHLIQFVTTYSLTRWDVAQWLEFRGLTVLTRACALIPVVFGRPLLRHWVAISPASGCVLLIHWQASLLLIVLKFATEILDSTSRQVCQCVHHFPPSVLRFPSEVSRRSYVIFTPILHSSEGSTGIKLSPATWLRVIDFEHD